MNTFENMIYISEDATPVKDSGVVASAEEFLNECRTKTGQTLYICQDLMLLALREASFRLQMAGAVGVRVGESEKVWPLNPRMAPDFWADVETFAPGLTVSDRLLSMCLREDY